MECEILLVAVNAGYAHTSLSLRCIMANLGDLEGRTRILEVDSSLSPVQIAERVLEFSPRIVAFSTYIWNASAIADALRVLAEVRPGIVRVAGGPQIVPHDDPSGLVPLLDVAVCGEGELAAPAVFRKILASEAVEKIVDQGPLVLEELKLPYRLYSDADLATRMVYAEATRGCPFQCEYCTSSDSGGIRKFPLEKILAEFEGLLRRGARHFKFLDRSFNFGGEHSLAVLDFFIEHMAPELRLHFEFTPDELDAEWRARLKCFEPGMLHIEMGVQTWNKSVADRIRRPLKPEAVERALRFMVEDAGADVHADLIAGLPGETPGSFVSGFDRLVAIAPAEVQVGILKRLPGTAIGRHDDEFAVKWSPAPPYEILENSTFSFEEMRKMERFSRCWDMLYNRRRFRTSAPMLWCDGSSPFSRVTKVSDSVYGKVGRMHSVSPKRLAESLLEVLTGECSVGESEARAALERDARESAWNNS